MKRGVALIEFAGSMILLAVVFAGIFQIGYTFYIYGTLVDAVRAGARYASLQSRPGDRANDVVRRAVQNLVVYGDPATPNQGATPLVNGLTRDNVEVDFGPKTATVSVRAYKIDSLFSRLSLDGRPAVTFPLTSGMGQ